MKHISFLIKPASGLCNIRCKYCFYRDLTEGVPMHIMGTDVSHKLIDRAFEEAEESVSFLFQGGEPTIAGLDFFRDFVSCVSKKKTKKLHINYGIQTNGTLITEEWVSFFRQNNFLIGLSLDGDARFHNRNRVGLNDNGTFHRVMGAKRLMDTAGLSYNALCVVTNSSARAANHLYAWFKKQGFHYLQFISCFDPLGEVRGCQPYSLTPGKYGKFLCELFDEWYKDWCSGNYVSIRLFDDYVHILAGMQTSTCATSGRCGSYMVVEHDGSCYPCDFYVTPNWRLGFIQNRTITELQNSEVGKRFLEESDMMDVCRSCSFHHLCRGGCKRDRLIKNGKEINYYCDAFKMLFSHALHRMEKIAVFEATLQRYR